MSNTTSSVPFSIRKSSWKNLNTFPDVLYIDANPILDVIFHRTFSSLVEDYWCELVKRGGMITWSPHTLEEVITVVHTNKYIDYAISNGISDQRDKYGNLIKPSWKFAEDTISVSDSIVLANQTHQEVQTIFSNLEQYGLEVDKTDEESVRMLAISIHKNCGGSLKDAKHIAFANLNGVNNIMSHDSGLLRIPGQNIFGASSSLLSKSTNQAPINFLDLSSHFGL